MTKWSCLFVGLPFIPLICFVFINVFYILISRRAKLKLFLLVPYLDKKCNTSDKVALKVLLQIVHCTGLTEKFIFRNGAVCFIYLFVFIHLILQQKIPFSNVLKKDKKRMN